MRRRSSSSASHLAGSPREVGEEGGRGHLGRKVETPFEGRPRTQRLPPVEDTSCPTSFRGVNDFSSSSRSSGKGLAQLGGPRRTDAHTTPLGFRIGLGWVRMVARVGKRRSGRAASLSPPPSPKHPPTLDRTSSSHPPHRCGRSAQHGCQQPPTATEVGWTQSQKPGLRHFISTSPPRCFTGVTTRGDQLCPTSLVSSLSRVQ